MKKYSLSVTEFALPCPRVGSIDAYSGFGRGAAQAGIEIHQQIQATRAKEHKSYKSEVTTSHVFEKDGYLFEIGGRMDGFFDLSRPRIEEIKTTFNTFELIRHLKDAQDDHPYILQVRTYGYIHYLKSGGELPQLSLHLHSTRNGETYDYDVMLDVIQFEKWLELRLEELVEEAKRSEKRVKRRKKSAEALAFPFTQPRSGQRELIASIEEGIKEGRPLMIQAPTGLGKTVGVLYPTLKESLARGQKVIYATPKNSQHTVAEDAVERFQDMGASIRSMTITAKSKMCFKDEPVCNPEYCEFAKDHYTKVARGDVMGQLAKKKKLTAKVFKNVAEEHHVCPFEIQLDAAVEADTVICDYNYVFAPRSAFGRLANPGFGQDEKPNLVIDEAHNLPSRAMDHYSPSLSVAALERMREEIHHLPLAYQLDMKSLIEGCIDVVKSCAPVGADKPCEITPPIREFHRQEEKLSTFLSAYLKSDIKIEPRDVVLRLCSYWSDFTAALDFATIGRKEFFTTFNPFPATVRIVCCDASEMLKDAYDDYEHVVAFSATLKPFEFYTRLGGLQEKNLKQVEFKSPFLPGNRKLLLIPQISSKYSERERNYPRIADAIERIVPLRKGNYFAFFPSFDFMERVLRELKIPDGFQVIKQARNMKNDDVADVLDRLKDPWNHSIVFAVQGGVFSEGVDYPGEMAIGAFIVGPPLPSFDFEREKMREYYETNYSAGFDYAYTYPAMAKAVQAAGRVIRSETDRGLIVLMDNRFMQTSYANCMPQDWFEENPRELVSEKILADVKAFWDSRPD